MTIHLYNTLTREKEAFAPIDAKNVRMYVCGPTVYDYAHIGNARPVVVFDTLFRLLRHTYGAAHVTYVRNITDIEDKIMDAAKANGESIADLTQRTTKFYHDDMDALNATRPSREPRATEYVPQMVAIMETLVAKGFAYAAEGHVLFNVPAMPDYGQLSRRSRAGRAGTSNAPPCPVRCWVRCSTSTAAASTSSSRTTRTRSLKAAAHTARR